MDPYSRAAEENSEHGVATEDSWVSPTPNMSQTKKSGKKISQAIGPHDDLLNPVMKRKLRWYTDTSLDPQALQKPSCKGPYKEVASGRLGGAPDQPPETDATPISVLLHSGCCLTELVSVAMAASTTPPPMVATLHPVPVTNPMNGVTKDYGSVAALVGGVVGATLLILIGVMAFLWWCRPGQKGSYTTNEMVDKDNGDTDDDDESVCSDTALKHNVPSEEEEDE
ncbi:uncharacterized protein LOC133660885 [Entelurus aequoreus]|uniref:uncharacterized protein LOC133660885 n=1 Tax=Entelurus aequoreus TaxID=161455 RepID=UPI002B1E517B|nr:uncharacterized protein LOC133660885 [Entelurus aequoreus]